MAAQVSVGMNAPAAASIQVIPTDPGLTLHPRSMVHLFYLDDRVVETASRERMVVKLKDYKLLYCGEIIGFTTQQTPQSRGLVLQCVDFSSYWDSIHATAIEYGPGGNWADHSSFFTGSDSYSFDDIVSHIPEKIVSWLGQTPKTPGLESVTGLAGGIIRMLEVIGGVRGSERGVNDFFTMAELRCKILQQIVAEENDNTARQLMSGQVFAQWIKNGIQNIGQQVTFRDIMKVLCQYIYYEAVPNPTAKYVPSSTVTNNKMTSSVMSAALGVTGEGVAASTKLTDIEEGAKGANGTGGTRESWASSLALWRSKAEEASGLLRHRTIGPTAGDAKTAVAKIGSVITDIDALLQALPETGQTVDLSKLIQDVTQAKTAIAGTASTRTTKTTKIISGGIDRLNSHILRPDCWFAPPPVCNVIFPEQYVSLQYDRNYLGEVSRLLVLANDYLVGQSRILSGKVVAPNAQVFAGIQKKWGNTRGYRELMPHEFHTGIVPREEWLPNSSQTSAPGQLSPEEASAGDRLSWSKRIALFSFYKYRFAQRGASIGGRFNPNLVCGFPALVIRAPYMPGPELDGKEPSIDDMLLNAGSAPIHLVGMIGSLSHNVDQAGGMSSVALHHVRHHNGTDDEFLNFIATSKTVKRNFNITLSLSEIMAMSASKERDQLLDFLTAITYQGIESQNSSAVVVTSTNGSSTSQSLRSRTAAPSGVVLLKDGKMVPKAPVHLGKGGKGPLGIGTIQAVYVLNADRVKVKDGPKSLAFTQVIVQVSTDLSVSAVPVEEVLRPTSWFSKKYANDSIGSEIYQPFFGCNSIIDGLRTSLGDEVITDSMVEEKPEEVSATEMTGRVAAVAIRLEKVASHSVERSANLLAYLYGKVKRSRGDVEDFIQQYTHRPIATKEDLLGDDNLEFDIKENGQATPKQVTMDLGDGMSSTVTPKVGFHSGAVHPQLVESSIKLAGLVEDSSLRLPRINDSGKRSEILAKYDVRKEKRDRVLAYQISLLSTRAFRG